MASSTARSALDDEFERLLDEVMALPSDEKPSED